MTSMPKLPEARARRPLWRALATAVVIGIVATVYYEFGAALWATVTGP